MPLFPCFPRAPLACLAVLLALAGCANVTPVGRAPLFDETQVIALVPDQRSAANLEQAARSQGYRLEQVQRLRGLGLRMLTFEKPSAVTGAEAIAALEAAEPRSTVGVNHAYSLQQSSGIDALNYANAILDWPSGGCRARVPVGLIDGGVDPRAPALASVQVISESLAPGASGPSRHGTEVASVLADNARLRQARIYSANVMSQGQSITGADAMIRAIDWLAESGVRVVNLSLAGPYNKLLDLAVERAVARNMILVAAVGNAGPGVAPQYPAAFEDVVAVTAVDANLQIYRNAVRGPHVDVAAPGVDVFVRSSGSGRFVTGTSIAAPFVAARIAADARLLSAQSIPALRQRLAQSSEDLGPGGADTLFGFGLLKAEGLCPSRAS